jgi:hypothetical protein
MEYKLQNAELKVMSVLWKEGDLTAKEVSNILKEEVGWNMNTTYTLIKRCIQKGFIERYEPHFMCHPLVSKEEVQQQEISELTDKVFDGSRNLLFASLLGGGELSEKDIQYLKELINKLEETDGDVCSK